MTTFLINGQNNSYNCNIKFKYYLCSIIFPNCTNGVLACQDSCEEFKSAVCIINMYYNKKDIIASKTQSKSNFSTGSVNIYNKNVILRYNSYDKREKLLDKDGK